MPIYYVNVYQRTFGMYELKLGQYKARNITEANNHKAISPISSVHIGVVEMWGNVHVCFYPNGSVVKQS